MKTKGASRMIRNKSLRSALFLIIAFSLFATSLPIVGYSQSAGVSSAASQEYSAAGAAIEEKIEARRKE
ncbi:MAG TPA: hypothetical protein DDW24_08895, partial [Blastocatellia bacterium]|nr:hypothetical protein [Blastocatellia bacterium]